MASVATKGSPQWHASIHVWHADPSLPKGGRWKWTWKATGIPAGEPKKVAQKVADALQEAANNAHPSNLRRGDQRAFSEALEQIWKAAGMAVPKVSASWVEFVPEYLAACEVNPDSRTIYANFLNRFAAHIGPAKAKGMMHVISHADCQSYYDSLLATGLTVKTCRGYLKSVRACFDRAQKLGIISLNPASLVKTPLGASSQRKPLSLEEIAAVMRVLEDPPPEAVHCRGFLHGMTVQWKTAVLFGLWCGMRLGDATGRKWSDLDKAMSQVTFVPQKKMRRGVPVTLPLVGALRDQLAALPRNGEWITPDLASCTKNSIRFGKLLNLAGVSMERPARAGTASRPKRLKSFHSLRHTVLTEMARSGADKQLRQLLADHDDPAVNDRYTHAEVERLAAALEKALPAAAAAPKK